MEKPEEGRRREFKNIFKNQILQGYPKRIRLQRRLYENYLVRFVALGSF